MDGSVFSAEQLHGLRPVSTSQSPSFACCNAEQQQAALEKPIDLFKAIFENDDESSEDEPESGAEAAPTSTHQQSAAASTSSPADRLQASSAPAAQDHQQHTNGQLPASQLHMQLLQQPPSIREVGSQLQQQLQPAAPVQPDGLTVHQSAAEQLVSRIRQSEDLGSHRSSKKKRKHREDDEEQPRKKKHKKEKDRKHSGTGCMAHAQLLICVTMQGRLSPVCLSVHMQLTDRACQDD